MKSFLLILACLSLSNLHAQKKDRRNGYYSAYLSTAEVSKNIIIGAVDTSNSTYEDSIIRIVWVFGRTQIDFELQNKSAETLKLIWDDAAFVSLANETGKVFHKGIKYIDRENSQPPTSIYKGTTLSDLIAPTSYVYYTSGQYGGWNSKQLIPAKHGAFSTKVEFDESLIGQTMRVILPIKMNDQTLEYTFFLKVKFIEKK